MTIRYARVHELPLLQQIENAAGEQFRAIGMPEIADDVPMSIRDLAACQAADMVWVSVDGHDHPVAALAALAVDGNLHLEQLSVHPGHSRRGLGRALIDHADGVAARAGMPALTLTTFADVPWNAPYYARLGFRTLAEAELGAGLRAIRAGERDHGLDRWPRVCMRRDVHQP